jgi:hypothetical protein
MSIENYGYNEPGKLTQYLKIEANPESDKQVEQVKKEIYLYENIQPVTHSKGETIHLCTQHYYHNGTSNTGCPNYNSGIEDCPPEAMHIKEAFRKDSIHLLTVQFPFQEYIDIKKEKHPTWSNRALINQRHWQAHLKRLLDRYWERIKDRYPDHVVIRNPEAMGVNVEETMKKLGIQLQWCEQNEKHEIVTIAEYMHHVYLLAKKL